MEEILNPKELPVSTEPPVMEPAEVAGTYSPLTLAFLGDGVYEIEIRNHIVRKGNCAPKKLNEQSSFFAMAHTQAVISDLLLPYMTQKEADVFRRGRNASPNSHPKHASLSDYHKATGLESLFGYLYLTGQKDRIRDMVRFAWDFYTENSDES